jgi:DNA-binding MarR family transcriptional regulator
MAVTTDEANDVFLALLRVQKLLVAAKHLAPRIGGVDESVDSSVYPVLFAVNAVEDATVRISDLATRLHNDVSTVSRQVSSLVANGLLAKTADPSDRRALVVSLTDAGREAVQRIQATRAAWFQGLLRDWDSNRADAFVSSLRELGDALDANLRERGGTPPAMPFAAARTPEPTDRTTRKD